MSDQQYRTKETHPYDCKECGRLFATVGDMYTHAKMKHGTVHKKIRQDDDHFTEADYQTWMRL